MTKKGRVVVDACLADKNGRLADFPIPFNDMKVQLPILSLRNTMKRGHSARLNENGGYLRNLITRTKVPVYEKEGVYYLKVKIRSPDTDTTSSSPDAGFARQGP